MSIQNRKIIKNFVTIHKYQHIYLCTIYINTYTDCIGITDSNIHILTIYCDFSGLKHFDKYISNIDKYISNIVKTITL